MEDYNWDLEELLAYCRLWGWRERRANLLRPHADIWPKDPAGIEYICDRLFEPADEQTRLLFLACSAAGALLSPKPYREKALKWLRSKIIPEDIGLPFDSWGRVFSWHWLRGHIPVLSPHTGKGAIINVMLGMGEGNISPPWPLWAKEVLDETALGAVIEVARIVRCEQQNSGLFFWPIIDKSAGHFIRGRSLSLPVYLGWKTVASGLNMPPLAATGNISTAGCIEKVGGVIAKAAAAAMHDLKGILYPKCCSVDPKADISIELIPVEDITEAEAFWKFYTPGAGQAMLLALNSLDTSPSRLVHLLDIPYGLLVWMKKERSCLEPIIAQGLYDEGTAERFVTRLEQLLGQTRCPVESTGFILSTISPEMIESLGERRPDLAFRLCEAGVECFNHLGNSVEAGRCSSMASSFSTLFAPMEGSDERIFLLHNLSIVQAHNRFEFDPSAEANITKELIECLRHMEEELLYRRKSRPDAVMHGLGAFYGTIAQNYGFCGPAYIANFEASLAKAMDAFGGGKAPNPAMENWQREHSYSVYAYLDAGRYDEAAKALSTYLDTEDITQYRPDGNQFRQAALMRFLSQTSLSFPDYFTWAARKMPSVPARHPWQLWLYNLGNLKAAGVNLRRTAWTRSASICLAQEGETLKVMALLPLSALYRSGSAQKDFLEAGVEKVYQTLDSGSINKRHFALLLNARSWQDLLDIAAENAETLFPFSYR